MQWYRCHKYCLLAKPDFDCAGYPNTKHELSTISNAKVRNPTSSTRHVSDGAPQPPKTEVLGSVLQGAAHIMRLERAVLPGKLENQQQEKNWAEFHLKIIGQEI